MTSNRELPLCFLLLACVAGGYPCGHVVRQFGRSGADDDKMEMPFGTAMWDENVLVADRWKNRIDVYRLTDGSLLGYFGVASPIGIAVSCKHGMIFVTSEHLQCLRVLDSSGVEIRCQRSFQAPYGVAVSNDRDWVYVSDEARHCVEVLHINGSHVRTIGSYGKGPGQFLDPCGVTVRNGFVYVVDYRIDCISVFDESDGSFVHRFGSEILHKQSGIACGDGWVAVTNTRTFDIVLFNTNNGSLLSQWRSGDGPTLMCWSDEYEVLIVPLACDENVTVFA